MFLYCGYVDVEFVGAAFCEGIQLRKGGVDLLPGVLCFLEMERERQLAELVGEVGTRAHPVRVQCGRGECIRRETIHEEDEAQMDEKIAKGAPTYTQTSRQGRARTSLNTQNWEARGRAFHVRVLLGQGMYEDIRCEVHGEEGWPAWIGLWLPTLRCRLYASGSGPMSRCRAGQ